jgi:hypothetical protein
MKRLMVVLALVAVFLLGVAHSAAAEGVGFKLAQPVLTGDICYDIRAHSLAFGPSYTLGTFGKDQMFEVKGMWAVFPDENIPNKLGVGVAVSIPKALAAAGVQNIPAWFNPSIGVLGLVDVSDGAEFSIGIYATLIKIPL